MADADLYDGPVRDDSDPPEVVTDLPPSSKLVYKTLEWNGRLTQQAIIERSLLSARTVRDALSRLEDHDVVERDVYYRDARQNVYALAADEAHADPATGAAAVE